MSLSLEERINPLKHAIDWDIDVDEDGLMFIEEIDEAAKDSALSDMEEEYGSETVNDYMNYGVWLKKVKKALDTYTGYVVYLGIRFRWVEKVLGFSFHPFFPFSTKDSKDKKGVDRRLITSWV